jgi:hypothetical protein
MPGDAPGIPGSALPPNLAAGDLTPSPASAAAASACAVDTLASATATPDTRLENGEAAKSENAVDTSSWSRVSLCFVGNGGGEGEEGGENVRKGIRVTPEPHKSHSN